MKLQGLFKLQGSGSSQKIPANDHDNYDENDKIALLEAWLTTEAGSNKALKYVDVDNYLKIELGSTKRLLPTVFNRNTAYKIDISGSNVFKFHYQQHFAW